MNCCIRGKPQLLEKVSCKIRSKAKNIFLHTSKKSSENFDIKYLQQSKTDLSKEIKKKLLRKDTLRVLEAVIRNCCVKKVSVKILPPVYLHIIETDIS